MSCFQLMPSPGSEPVSLEAPPFPALPPGACQPLLASQPRIRTSGSRLGFPQACQPCPDIRKVPRLSVLRGRRVSHLICHYQEGALDMLGRSLLRPGSSPAGVTALCRASESVMRIRAPSCSSRHGCTSCQAPSLPSSWPSLARRSPTAPGSGEKRPFPLKAAPTPCARHSHRWSAC